MEQERHKIRAELQHEQNKRVAMIEKGNKQTFNLVLKELYMIREEHDSQIAKFDLLIDKQRRRFQTRLQFKDQMID